MRFDARAYAKSWKRARPTYNRDWMRRYRASYRQTFHEQAAWNFATVKILGIYVRWNYLGATR